MTWIIYETKRAGTHIMPKDEMELHFPNECTCGVYFDEESQAYVHNAFDGREKFETGERKTS